MVELIILAPLSFPICPTPPYIKNVSKWAQQARQHVIDICVGNWQSFTGSETSLHLPNAMWLQWWGTPSPQKQMAWVCSPAKVQMSRDLNSLNWAMGERDFHSFKIDTSHTASIVRIRIGTICEVYMGPNSQLQNSRIYKTYSLLESSPVWKRQSLPLKCRLFPDIQNHRCHYAMNVKLLCFVSQSMFV